MASRVWVSSDSLCTCGSALFGRSWCCIPVLLMMATVDDHRGQRNYDLLSGKPYGAVDGIEPPPPPRVAKKATLWGKVMDMHTGTRRLLCLLADGVCSPLSRIAH